MANGCISFRLREVVNSIFSGFPALSHINGILSQLFITTSNTVILAISISQYEERTEAKSNVPISLQKIPPLALIEFFPKMSLGSNSYKFFPRMNSVTQITGFPRAY